MDKVLSIDGWKEIPDFECLGLFDAVTAPVCAWEHRRAPDVTRKQAYEEARFRDLRSADKAGFEAGRVYKELGLDAYVIGGESRWAGVDGQPVVKDPYENMAAFVTAFRVSAPTDAKLIYKGIAYSRSSRSTGYRKLHDTTLMSQFDHVCVPNLGIDPAAIREWYKARTLRYRLVTDCYPEFGVGRIDRNGDLWGDWQTSRRLILDTNPSAVSFSFMRGSRLQMRVGHPYHPPLTQCVKEI